MNSTQLKIIQEEKQANNETEHLQALLVHVKEALRRGLSARKRMTKNNPATSGGQYFYSEVTRALRELLKPFGYEALSLRNVELTINKDKAISIYLCGGCDQTGNKFGVPQSSTDKGDFTLDLFSLKYDDLPNLDLFPELLPQATPKNKLKSNIWFLLHHYDKNENRVKAELAKPVSYNKNGYITGFDLENRIFINTDFDDNLDVSIDFNDEIDFEIEEISKANV
jgi:hypothetical protein